MELVYDWKSFQSFFYPKKIQSIPSLKGSIYGIIDHQTILMAFSEGEDLSTWSGATLHEFITAFADRQCILYNREEVDTWLQTSAELEHFYKQTRFLKSHSKPEIITQKIQKNTIPHSHFLLHAIETWWHQLFPSNYGIYLCLDEKMDTSLLLILQRGQLRSFHVPDFIPLSQEKRKNPTDLIQYLSEHYFIPVQGIFSSSEAWHALSSHQRPWPKISSGLHSGDYQLVPSRWGLHGLIFLRRYFGL